MIRRRLTLAGMVAVAACAAIAAIAVSSSSGESKYSVDVIFDDSRGLSAGQLVEVAGAKVGTIADVSVTRDYKARVHLRVDRKFAPFRKNAKCAIKPQGLIAENYVDCDPGTPSAPELRSAGGQAPTVAVERTTQPVNLTDLFEVWNTPTRQRATVLFSMLGMATSGRGSDLNAVLRRLNPSLALARRTIGLLARQRDELAATVDATSETARALARRPEDTRSLLRHAGRVTTQTASHRRALGEGVRRLPALLRRSVPALHKLDAVMVSGRPLLDQIGLAAPDLNRLAPDVPRLASRARPTLRRLAPVLRRGAVISRRAAPLAKALRDYTHASLPSSRQAGQIFPTLEGRGFNSGLLTLFYNLALAGARYDDTSHVLPAHVGLTACTTYATTPQKECGAGTGVTAGGPATASRAKAPPRAATPVQPDGTTGEQAPRAPAPTPPAGGQPPTPNPSSQQTESLLDYLLR